MRWQIVAFIVLPLTAAYLFHLTPDMPWGTTPDEHKKSLFVANGTGDFKHPLLLLQVVRFVNWFADLSDPKSILTLGRMVAAGFGGLFVFSTMLLTRQCAGGLAAVLAGILVAAAPLTAVHAQNFKEDIVVAPMLMLSLLLLAKFVERGTTSAALAFGLLAGLASSAKYIGAVIIPFALIVPLICQLEHSSQYYLRTGFSFLITIAVFTLINFNLFFEWHVFVTGLRSEVEHSLTGHRTYFPGWMAGFAYTWKHSVVPGLGAPFAIASVAATTATIVQWRRCPSTIQLAVGFGLLWYALHELSPMKPVVGGPRHMTLVAGVAAVVVAYWIARLSAYLAPTAKGIAAPLLALALAAPAAWQSYSMARSVHHDTILVAERIVNPLGSNVIWPTIAPIAGRYSNLYSVAQFANAEARKRIEDCDYVILIERTTSQYFEAVAYENQSNDVVKIKEFLDGIHKLQSILIEATAPSFSVRNHPIRIVAVRGDFERLRMLAEQAARHYPIKVSYPVH